MPGRRISPRRGDAMTTDESGDPESGRPGGSRRRPPSTIELEATEVENEASSDRGPPAATAEAPPASEPESAPSTEPQSPPAATEPGLDQQPPLKPRGVFWPVLAASIVGGAIAAAILVGIWVSGILPSGREQGQPQWDALSTRLAGLDRQVRDLAARPQSVPDDKRFDRIEARLKQLESAASPPAVAATDAGVSAKLGELDRRVDEALAAARDAKGRAESAATQAQRADAQIPANAADRNEVDSLKSQVGNLEQQVKADAARLGKIAANTDRGVRFALVAIELRVAVDRGMPFTAELEAAKQLAPDPSALAPLEPAASTGVPTPMALAQQLSKLAPAMLKASVPRPEGGVLERLQASAERLVRIRRIEEASSDEPSAVVARAELKATRGDITGALA